MPDQANFSADFTLYYLDDSYNGLPLTFADFSSGSGTGLSRARSFIYGDCTPPVGGDGGCAPPIEIQNWSICTRFPRLYRYPRSAPRTSPLRGAQSLPAGGGLDIYTGRTTVVIFGEDGRAISAALRRVADDVAPETLPPPAPGALEGELPCQAAALKKFSR